MTIILPSKKYTPILRIGDMVRHAHPGPGAPNYYSRKIRDHHGDITGIIVDIRYTKERLAGDIFLRPKHGKREQAQVLCNSGELQWYLTSELNLVDEVNESW